VRKLIVANMMSLDGFYTGPGDDVMVLPDYDSFDLYNVERLRAADTLLLGRTSFDGFKGFWPPIAEDPDASPTHREISERNNAIEKVVVSDSLTPDETAPWDDARIVKRADAHAQIAELKGQPGREILVFGSRTLWSDLLANGLVDELHLMIGARVKGGGTPMFEGEAPVSLELLETRMWDGSANVMVRYGVRKDDADS
jgi:dihydrofolate reductase